MLDNKIKRKKIVHLAYAHAFDDIRIYCKECISLAENGYEIIYVTADRKEKSSRVNENGVTCVTLLAKSKSRVLRVFKYLYNCYKYAVIEDAECYHVHEPLLLIPAYLIKKIHKKKVIFDSHENFHGYGIPSESNVLKKSLWLLFSWLQWQLIRYVCMYADGVISATDGIAEELNNNGISSIVIKNYPLMNDIQCNMDDYMLRGNECCYIGGISFDRGITYVIESLENIDANLNLAGLINNTYKSQLESMSEWRKVNYLGILDRKCISDLLNNSIVGIVTLLNTKNYYNSLPIKLFEYMAAGLPIICSKFPLWEEIIKDEKCGLSVEPTDKKSIEQAIKYIIDNRQEAMQMGKNGRRAILEKYNWNVENEKLLNYYNKIVGSV